MAGATLRSTLVPWLVLIMGIVVTLLLFVSMQGSVERVARLRFEREANNANAIITGRLQSYSEIVFALRALFASDEPVNRLKFHQFVESLNLKQRYPGFASLNYAAHVLAKDKRRFEESVRRDTSLDALGYPEFAIKPPGERPEYFVAVFLEPMAGFEFGFGLDIAANPMAADPEKVAATVRLQRDSGNLMASGQPLRVNQGKESVYLAMRLPVYRNGMETGSVEQRRAAYLGSVGAAFDVESLMRSATDGAMLKNIRIRLYDTGIAPGSADSGSVKEKRLLFDSDQIVREDVTGAVETGSASAFEYAMPVHIAGRVWTLQYSELKDVVISDTDRLLPLVILAGGLFISLLLFGILHSMTHSRGQALRIANEITRDLRDSTERLQAISRRLVDVQETERRQVSRELHDRVGQNLTALSISLDILKSQIAGHGKNLLRSRLEDASALLESTTSVIENVMSDLRPPMLDDYGLLPALQWYANEYSDRTGIQVRVVGDERMKRLPQASEIGLFRIAQEALNNVAKHAHATRADIVLEHAGREFIMVISDNGSGFDFETPGAKRRQGLGMMTMRERTQAVGGRFEVNAAPGGGTQVMVRIPGS
jgi:signal transduction histidine kinase